jgi:hypothetical protein
MFALLLSFLFACAIGYVIWLVLANITMPHTLRLIVSVVFAIIAIYVLFQFLVAVVPGLALP